MKKHLFLAVTAMMLSAVVSFGQKMGEGAARIDIGAIQKKIEQSNAAIKDPKTSERWQTWLERGDIFFEAANAPTKGLFRTMGEDQINKLYVPKPTKLEPVTIGSEKYNVYESDRFIVYVSEKDKKVAMWTENKLIIDSTALDIAADAYDIAFSMDVKAVERAYKGLHDIVSMVKDRASIAQRLGNIEKAAKEYRRSYIIQTYPAYSALNKNPEMVVDTTDLFLAAQNFTVAKDFVAALECLQELLRLEYYNDGNTYYYLSHAYNGVDKSDSAHIVLMEGVRKFPLNGNLYRRIPVMYVLDEEADIKVMEDIMKKAEGNKEEKDWGRLYTTMAQAYYKRQMDEKALEYYNKASAADPDNFGALYSAAQLYIMQAGNRVKEIQEISENLPKDEYDKAQEEVNDIYRKAIPLLERAHNVDPQHAGAVDWLAKLTFQLRDTSDEMMEKSKKYEEINKSMQEKYRAPAAE